MDQSIINFELVSNVAATSRQLYGREYLVVPMTMVVPGVLHGSRGPLLYTKEEIASNPSAWNSIPIVKNHPSARTARTPEYLDKAGMGIVLNAHISTDGKLVAEGWFDVQRTQVVDNSIYEKLKSGEKIELSTGVGVSIDNEVGDNPVFNGVRYEGIAKNLKPDHLAILPDDEGACSLKDGCGVNNSKGWKERFEQLWNAVFPSETRKKIPKEDGMALSADQRGALISEVVNCSCSGNGGKKYAETDREILNKLSDEGLIALHSASKGTASGGNKKSEEGVTETKVVVTNELTADQKELIEYALNKKAEEKKELIKSLVAKVPADQRQAQVLNLSGKTLDELTELKKTVDALNSSESEGDAGSDFSGAAPRQTGVSNGKKNGGKSKEEEPLEEVAWNWGGEKDSEED